MLVLFLPFTPEIRICLSVSRCYNLIGSIFSFLVPHEIVMQIEIKGIISGRDTVLLFSL